MMTAMQNWLICKLCTVNVFGVEFTSPKLSRYFSMIEVGKEEYVNIYLKAITFFSPSQTDYL